MNEFLMTRIAYFEYYDVNTNITLKLWNVNVQFGSKV